MDESAAVLKPSANAADSSSTQLSRGYSPQSAVSTAAKLVDAATYLVTVWLLGVPVLNALIKAIDDTNVWKGGVLAMVLVALAVPNSVKDIRELATTIMSRGK